MDINFKGQRALVTGAGKGKIFFFMYWKITELYRERMARAPQFYKCSTSRELKTKFKSDLLLIIFIVFSPLEAEKLQKRTIVFFV